MQKNTMEDVSLGSSRRNTKKQLQWNSDFWAFQGRPGELSLQVSRVRLGSKERSSNKRSAKANQSNKACDLLSDGCLWMWYFYCLNLDLSRFGIDGHWKNCNLFAKQRLNLSLMVRPQVSMTPLILSEESASHPTLPFLVKGKCPKFRFAFSP